jgi:hypothetical protein
MAVTQTVACTYQFQRKRNTAGKLIAEIADYYMALQIVKEASGKVSGRRAGRARKEFRLSRKKEPSVTATWRKSGEFPSRTFPSGPICESGKGCLSGVMKMGTNSGMRMT